MSVPYDRFTDAFLAKITEYDFASMKDFERNGVVDGYMKRALANFRKICKYDFSTTGDDLVREFDVDVADGDMDELAEIVSEGMLVQWLKPYTYRQENLENVLSTKDFSTYSPSGLLMRVRDAYTSAQKDFTNMMREYSYNHGNLEELHL